MEVNVYTELKPSVYKNPVKLKAMIENEKQKQ